METNENLQIDVDAVLRQRAAKYYKFIPKALIRWLERTICQEEMNGFLQRHGHERDAEFCHSLVYDELGIKVDFAGQEHLPPATQRKVLFVSNHPLGGLDGMILIDYLQSRYGGRLGFVVNDLLSAVKPLEGVFLPINKHGAQSRQSVAAIDDFFASDDPMVMFPAGLVSRRQKKGVVKDLEWQKMFVTKARQSGRLIIPVHFCGENSPFFYKFAKFRKNIGLKFNIEMIYLPREVFRARGKRFEVIFGTPVAPDSFPKGMSANDIAQNIKEMVYELKNPQRQ